MTNESRVQMCEYNKQELDTNDNIPDNTQDVNLKMWDTI